MEILCVLVLLAMVTIFTRNQKLEVEPQEESEISLE